MKCECVEQCPVDVLIFAADSFKTKKPKCAVIGSRRDVMLSDEG